MGKGILLKPITIIDPTTGWFKVTQYDGNKAVAIVNLVEITWLYGYTWPIYITDDQGESFLSHDFKNTLI